MGSVNKVSPLEDRWSNEMIRTLMRLVADACLRRRGMESPENRRLRKFFLAPRLQSTVVNQLLPRLAISIRMEMLI